METFLYSDESIKVHWFHLSLSVFNLYGCETMFFSCLTGKKNVPRLFEFIYLMYQSDRVAVLVARIQSFFLITLERRSVVLANYKKYIYKNAFIPTLYKALMGASLHSPIWSDKKNYNLNKNTRNFYKKWLQNDKVRLRSDQRDLRDDNNSSFGVPPKPSLKCRS